MASLKQDNNKPKKRKQSNVSSKQNSSVSKKPKLVSSSHGEATNLEKKKKPFMSFKKPNQAKDIKEPKTKKERRLHAKELAEARKKKRKRHYTLEQELANLWEKMRQRNIAKEDRSRLISGALNKMKGKIPEIASSHVSSRVLQTCVKYSTQPERDAVFEELKPHFLTLACNTYAVHLVNKMLDNASKKQLAEFVTTLRGHVASLLRHMVGSVVVEHAYQLGNASQKQELLMELYSTELQLFKDLATIKESRLLDIISKLDLKKSSVVRHMTSITQPILEKGIVDHSIIHKVLIEYLTLADKTSAADVIQLLSGPLLVRMIHTRDGARLGILCIKHGSTKERKKIVKGMKDHIAKIAHDQYGSLVLSCLIATVDDTKLVSKIVVRGLQTILKELVFDKNGRRPLLQLLHPHCSRYYSPDDLAAFDSIIPTLSSKSQGFELKFSKDGGSCNKEENVDKEENSEKEDTMAEADESTSLQNAEVTEGGKKDPTVRRRELLVDSGLADNLIDICTENAGDLLRSNFGKEVLYEVAIGGSGGILHPKLDDKLNALHEAIASLAAQPKSEESEEDHVLVNFHSSRTIRKLILDSPAFATTLWTKALQGNCESWVQGHSSKVISAYLETSDVNVRELVKKELQPYEDTLKVSQTKQPPNKT